jgi:3-dehydroquinate dehydratase/shikimate dehydrogenase
VPASASNSSTGVAADDKVNYVEYFDPSPAIPARPSPSRFIMQTKSRICAVIGRTRHKMIQAEIQQAAKQGADLIELRLDFLAHAPDFKRLLDGRPCPLIATFRRPHDGGRWAGNEKERQMLLRQAVVAGFDYVDLETDIADSIRRFGNVKRIISYHNLQDTPTNLGDIYGRMCGQDPDIIKISVTAQQPGDNLRVLRLLRQATKPTIAHCMGDLGVYSRLLSLRFGSPFTYGAFNKERTIAPGILSFQDLKKVYYADHINRDTKIYGIIGDPVGHSLSPLLHNRAFRQLGFNAMYVPFRVPRGELSGFIESFAEVPVSGYSVTIPHKEAALRLANYKDEATEKIGAANTLVLAAHGFSAFNTDAQAAMDSLRYHLPLAPDGAPGQIASRTVLILGAGGVARAIAHALRREGAAISITNRTADRAERLAEEVGCKYVDWAARNSVVCDTLINCTPVGMYPNLDESPIHPSALKPGLMVFDTIYTPETTLLVREARERGALVLTGVDMFVRQAALQAQLFTNRDVPLELMRKAVRRAISPVQNLDEEEAEA